MRPKVLSHYFSNTFHKVAQTFLLRSVFILGVILERSHANVYSGTICTTIHSINISGFLSLGQEGWGWNPQLGLKGNQST